jgi:hypothetical protein
MNEFMVVVGATSSGRKGSGLSIALDPLRVVDQEWAQTRVRSGLSTGEGLISAVRDPVKKQKPVKNANSGEIIRYQEEIDDHGVEDKRLLAIESEFASVLRRARQDGNTTSMLLRQAWDGIPMGTLTRAAPLRATGAHVSVIGHITREELERELLHVDAVSGFGNRFLWVASRRSKELPSGGAWHTVNTAPIVRQLAKATKFARIVGLVRRDPEADAAWGSLYSELTADRLGAYGKATGRAEAHTMRLALIYALLDCSNVIRIEHLEAGLEVWRYAEDSARMIFGSSTGNADADRILSALRENDLSRTAISGLFSNNLPQQRIEAALDLLQTHGLAEGESVSSNGGRPTEVWRLSGARARRSTRKKAPGDGSSVSLVSFVPRNPEAAW